MAKSKLFLVSEESGGDGSEGQGAKQRDKFVLLEEAGYVSEESLQRYLGDCPDLLPGDQISPDAPRRWLLVSREMSVPAAEGEGAR